MEEIRTPCFELVDASDGTNLLSLIGRGLSARAAIEDEDEETEEIALVLRRGLGETAGLATGLAVELSEAGCLVPVDRDMRGGETGLGGTRGGGGGGGENDEEESEGKA